MPKQVACWIRLNLLLKVLVREVFLKIKLSNPMLSLDMRFTRLRSFRLRRTHRRGSLHQGFSNRCLVWE